MKGLIEVDVDVDVKGFIEVDVKTREVENVKGILGTK